MDNQPDLLNDAKAVLKGNDAGGYTRPAPNLYPHQWLWDSCFVAIGLRHYDIDRAQQEILRLLAGQWADGMVPNMIFYGDTLWRRDKNLWRSWLNPNAPDKVATSGITQPPMLAEAIVRIGDSLSQSERRSWYKQVYPALLSYHQWLYHDRDPTGSGLILQIHPYETGLDNTPPWLELIHLNHKPNWIKFIEKTHFDKVLNMLRRDTRRILPGERMNTIDALLYYNMIRRLRRKRYDITVILPKSNLAIEDLTFNCIFIRANQHLKAIAKEIRQELPDEMLANIELSQSALEKLWDPYSNQYYSRDHRTQTAIKSPTIAALMPLYTGLVPKERLPRLIEMLEDEHKFGTTYPVPSVPADSSWFSPHMYWQGPTWLNINWLLIDGLQRSGYPDHAAALRESSIELVRRNGFYEYFSPLDGSPAGAADFSWTASLTIDLLQ